MTIMMKDDVADAAPEGTLDDGLDPDIRRFVAITSKRWRQHPPLDRVPVQAARLIAEEVRSHWTQGGPQMASTREVMVPFRNGTVRIRVYDPHA
ncbi:MAG: hypothetical protein ACREXP_24525, partial [Steroidobacteraceae bacterium]